MKMDKGLDSMAKLRQELIEQPALTWVLGFPLVASELVQMHLFVFCKKELKPHFTRIETLSTTSCDTPAVLPSDPKIA